MTEADDIEHDITQLRWDIIKYLPDKTCQHFINISKKIGQTSLITRTLGIMEINNEPLEAGDIQLHERLSLITCG